MQTHRILAFGDGEYRFQLGMGQILAVEEKCGMGIGAVYRHIMLGRYAKDDADFGYALEGDYGMPMLIEICRQGLIGGNSGFVDGQDVQVSDHRATHLVRTYLHPENGNPIMKAWDLAAAIVHACVQGYEPAEEVKPDAQKKSPPKPRRRRASTEARSSATA
jgi:hypothetical protein